MEKIWIGSCSKWAPVCVLVETSAMNKQFLLPLLLPVLGLAAHACLPEGDNAPAEANLRPLQVHEIQNVEASTQFAVDLFHQLRKSKAPNQFYSPYSIHVALSMAMNGNEGEALEEYLKVLGFGSRTVEEANAGAKDLTEFLLQVDPKVKLAIANAIWYRHDYQVKVPFKQTAEKFYQAEVSGIDVLNPNAVDIINNWIAQQTEGKIQDMLDRVPPDAVMYLVNAIYYKADWKYRFDKEKTEKAPFFVSPGKQVQVDMMGLGKAGTIKSYHAGDFAYLEIPYSTGQYSMGILLPEDHHLAEAEKAFTLENLELWRTKAMERNVLLKMPRFRLRQKMENMADDLMAMGLKIPFKFDARNFTLLFDNPTDLLKINRVIHDAVIEIDEKGSEAAAATVVEAVELTSLPSGPPTITLDRPFIFFIQEKHSGAILFMGKLSDPSLL